MAWCLVTPASRGVGHALTRHLLSTTKVPVVATARKDTSGVKSSILDGLKDVDSSRLTMLELDVTDESSVQAAAAEAKSMFPMDKEHHLRLAFAIPGILHPEKSPAQIDYQTALDTFKINTLGPMLLLKHFCAFLPRKTTQLGPLDGLPSHAVWGAMAARLGSTHDNAKGGWYSYRASKAGVVSLAKTFDLYLRGIAGENAVSVALHPGTVKTELSKDFWNQVEGGKLFTPEFAAERLVEVVKGLSKDHRGKFLDWQGKEISP